MFKFNVISKLDIKILVKKRMQDVIVMFHQSIVIENYVEHMTLETRR